MLLDDLTSLRNITLKPDCVVVIGGGAVGLHLAVQLVRQGQQVLVLESGNHVLSGFSPTSFSVVGRKHDGIRRGRSVALGGTSNLWGGQLVEFNPVDFAGRKWLDGACWPVSYEELASYYPATYEALGIDASMQTDAAVWAEIGKSQPELGYDTELFLTRWMKTPNLATLFRDEITSNPNLVVVLNATVVGFEGSGGRISSLRVLDARGEQHQVDGRAFVLAAGTIENVRLLLHAAEDASWQCPWRGNDNIGRYFLDHIAGRVARIRPRDARTFYDVFCTIVLRKIKFHPRIRLRNELLARERFLNCQATIAFDHSVKENLVYLKQFFKAALFSRRVGSLTGLMRNAYACARYMVPLMWKFVTEHRILIPSGSNIWLTVQAEVEPLPDSRITINPEIRDRFGLPQVVLDWRLSGNEVDHLLRFTQRVKAAVENASLADLEIEPALAAKNPSFLDQLHDTTHHAGGCRMGESERDGVVDCNLRVFGTENLYAAGACVFRTCSNANTTFTAMAFATRLSRHLTETSHATT